MLRFFLFFGIAYFFTLSLQAQVNAPELSCIKNDTLIWALPTNDCGTFNAYLVYGSTNENGPYNLIANINDPTSTSFFHMEAAGTTWYYYMQSDYNCPNSSLLSSDTLSNSILNTATITGISVENNAVNINWIASTSPQVIGYVIYKVTPLGTVPIDTIYDALTYTDLNAEPNIASEFYYVLATDACDNLSAFTSPHNTIFVQAVANVCDRTLILDWQPYNSWNNSIEKQEVWLSINNNPAELVATIAAEDVSYVYDNAIDGNNYCFYIKNIESITGTAVNSNEVCLFADVVRAVNELMITNVSVLADNQIEVNWIWTNNAQITNYSIIKNDNNTSTNLDFLPTFPLDRSNIFEDNTATNTGSISYELMTTDSCGNTVQSNVVRSIFLEGFALENRSNSLSWTDFSIDNADLLGYQVYEITNNDTSLIASISDVNNFIDVIDVSNPENANKCYFVAANASVFLPDGSVENIRSRSNTICINQFSAIFMPNAFAPYGQNFEFKPKVLFPDAVEAYSMQIYNRWGALLFESTDVNIGWDGRKAGKDQPQGAYTYFVRLRQPNGTWIEEKGVFVLVK